MTNDDYEMIPQQLLADLKDDVEALKKQLANPNAKMNELILEIESMKESVHELTLVFSKALEQVRIDGDASTNLHNITEKLQTVSTQNETIAKGMVAISDKLEDFMQSQIGGMKPAGKPVLTQRMRPPGLPPIQSPMGAAPPMPGRSAPKPMTDLPDDFPPPPPSAMRKGKRGLF